MMVIGIKFIISGPFDSTKTDSPSSTAVAEATQNLTLIGVQAVRVKVVQDLDEKVLFNGTLNRGETKTITKQDRVRVTVEDAKSLRLQLNGKPLEIPIQGYGRFVVP